MDRDAVTTNVRADAATRPLFPAHVLPRSAMPTLCAAAALFGGLALGGCYERVVRATGPGAGQYQVQEKYQEDYWVDRQVFGEDSPKGAARPIGTRSK